MSKRLREWRLSRARAARAARVEKPAAPDPPAAAPDPATAPAAPDPELTEKFAEKARDLDAVRKSVEDAASVSAGFWLSYLFVLFYIAITVGGVTHKDLLLESPVKLPFLSDVPVPLIAFFFLAPIVFIVFHAYTLLHFIMLAAKVGVYDAELCRQLGDAPKTRDAFRRQLPINIFVQFLAGPRDIRDGGLGWLLKAIAWVSLVIGPVLLLLLIQVRFLPYHLESLTWWHRLAILADIVLLWLLWPALLNSRSKLMWRLERSGESRRNRLTLIGRYMAGLTACLVPIGLAFTAATFPGERMDEWIGERQWIPPNRLTAWLGQTDSKYQPKWTSVHNLLFNSRRDAAGAWNKSLFATTLELSGFDALQAAKIEDPKKLDSLKHTLDLAFRNLEYAGFVGADLRKANLIGAQLRGAQLDFVRLQDASLISGQLQGATLVMAQLQGSRLANAQLQGASLFGARLQGASLESAQLQGVSLHNAELWGANLVSAELAGALLDDAELQGAQLDFAQLQGASLNGAWLQGTNLQSTRLYGASLAGVQLQGAWLFMAQLQGASLERAKLAGAVLDGAFVWRARFSLESLDAFAHEKIVWDGRYMKSAPIRDLVSNVEPWTEESYLALKKLVEDKVATPHSLLEEGYVKNIKEQFGESYRPPSAAGRDAALKRIEVLDPSKPFELEAEVPKWKKKFEAKAIERNEFEKARAEELKALACSGDADAIYVVRGMLNQGRSVIADAGAQAPGLVDAILKPDCPVSAALADADKAALKKLAKEASGTP